MMTVKIKRQFRPQNQKDLALIWKIWWNLSWIQRCFFYYWQHVLGTQVKILIHIITVTSVCESKETMPWVFMDAAGSHICWYLENILAQDLIFTEKKLIFSTKFVRVRQKSSIFCNKAGGSKMTVSSAHLENFVKNRSWTKNCHNYHQIWDPASSMKTA